MVFGRKKKEEIKKETESEETTAEESIDELKAKLERLEKRSKEELDVPPKEVEPPKEQEINIVEYYRQRYGDTADAEQCILLYAILQAVNKPMEK